MAERAQPAQLELADLESIALEALSQNRVSREASTTDVIESAVQVRNLSTPAIVIRAGTPTRTPQPSSPKQAENRPVPMSPFEAAILLLKASSVADDDAFAVTVLANDPLASRSFPGIENSNGHYVVYTAPANRLKILAVRRDDQGTKVDERAYYANADAPQVYNDISLRLQAADRLPLGPLHLHRKKGQLQDPPESSMVVAMKYVRQQYDEAAHSNGKSNVRQPGFGEPRALKQVREAELLEAQSEKYLHGRVEAWIGFVNKTADAPSTKYQHKIDNLKTALVTGGTTIQWEFEPPDSELWNIRGLPGITVKAGDKRFAFLYDSPQTEFTKDLTIWKRSSGSHEVRANDSAGKPHGESINVPPDIFDKDAASWVRKRILTDTPTCTLERIERGFKLTPLENAGVTITAAEWNKKDADPRLKAFAELDKAAASFTLNRDPDSEIGNHGKYSIFLNTPNGTTETNWVITKTPNDDKTAFLKEQFPLGDLPKISPIVIPDNPDFQDHYDALERRLQYGYAVVRRDNTEFFNDLDALRCKKESTEDHTSDTLDGGSASIDLLQVPTAQSGKRSGPKASKPPDVEFFSLKKSGANISVTPRYGDEALLQFEIDPNSPLYEPASKQLNEREFPKCAENTPVIVLVGDSDLFEKGPYMDLIRAITIGKRYVVKDGTPVPDEQPGGDPPEMGAPKNGVYYATGLDGEKILCDHKGKLLKGIRPGDVRTDDSAVYVDDIHIGHASGTLDANARSRVYSGKEWLDKKFAPFEADIYSSCPWLFFEHMLAADLETKRKLDPAVNDIAGKAAICKVITFPKDQRVADWFNRHRHDESDPKAWDMQRQDFAAQGYGAYLERVSKKTVTTLALIGFGLGVLTDQAGSLVQGWPGLAARVGAGSVVNALTNFAAVAETAKEDLKLQGLPHDFMTMGKALFKGKHECSPTMRKYRNAALISTILGTVGSIPIGVFLEAGVENVAARQAGFAFATLMGTCILPGTYGRERVRLALQSNFLEKKLPPAPDVDKGDPRDMEKHAHKIARIDYDTRSGPKMARVAYDWALYTMLAVGIVMNALKVKNKATEVTQSALLPAIDLCVMLGMAIGAKQITREEKRTIGQNTLWRQADPGSERIERNLVRDHAGHTEAPPSKYTPFSLVQSLRYYMDMGYMRVHRPILKPFTIEGPRKLAAPKSVQRRKSVSGPVPGLTRALSRSMSGSKKESSQRLTPYGAGQVKRPGDSATAISSILPPSSQEHRLPSRRGPAGRT